MKKSFFIINSALFEPDSFRINFNQKEVKLSQKECRVLEELCLQNGNVITRKQLIENIWNDSEGADAGLNKAILLLRRKFEANNMSGLIDTIPRVGYLLKANITITHEDNIRNDIVDDATRNNTNNDVGDIKTTSPTTVQQPTANYFKKHPYISGIASLLIIIFSIFVIKYFFIKKDIPLVIHATHTINGNTSYSTTESQKKPFLQLTDLSIKKSKSLSYDALISSKILSFILYNNNAIVGQKTFFINSDYDAPTQIKCIDKFLADYVSPNDFNEEMGSTILGGMKYSKQDYYSFCKNNTAELLAELSTKSTRLPNGGNDDHMMLVDSTLRTATGDIIFHIERYMRHMGWPSEAQTLKEKSVLTEKIDFNLIHSNALYASILSELTREEITVTALQKNKNLYVSDVFNGLLFYIKEMKAE